MRLQPSTGANPEGLQPSGAFAKTAVQLPALSVFKAETARKAEGFPGQRIVVLPRNIVATALKHPLLSRLLPTDIGYYPHARGHGFARKVGVEQAIFIYCPKGKGWCEMDGARREVKEGDLLVIPPRQPHAYGADDADPWSIYWFHAVGEDVRHLLPELGVRLDNPVLRLGEDPQILAIFGEILDLLEHACGPSQLLHASRTLGFLISVMIWRARQNWRTAPDAKQKIAYCIAHMKQHIDAPMRLKTLAEMAGFTPSYFNLHFKRETGFSCMEFLAHLRMHQAALWLDTTDWPVKTIAERLGYADALYFSRVFRLAQGVPPKEYRRLHKG